MLKFIKDHAHHFFLAFFDSLDINIFILNNFNVKLNFFDWNSYYYKIH